MDESESKKEKVNSEKRRFSQEQYDMLMQCSEEEKTKKEKDERGLWRNEWQYKLLKVCATDDEGIKKWNEWRKQNSNETIFLDGRSFHGFYLSRAYLNTGAVVINPGTGLHDQWIFRGQVYLRGSLFLQAKLHCTNFRGAHLEESAFNFAELEGSCLELAYLQCADFKGATFDKLTSFEGCHIDKQTNFRESDLISLKVSPRIRQLMECNIRRKNWEDWYKEHCLLRWPVRWFWCLSDYGISTWRVIIWFLVLSLFFATIYANCAYWWPIGIVSNLAVEPHLPIWHYFLLLLLRPIYFSIVTMTTLGFGDMYANAQSIWGHILLSLQVILGYVLLGALVTRFAVLFTAGGPAGKFAKEN